jgi:uncharacterized protein YjbJ (UPF0337 family)
MTDDVKPTNADRGPGGKSKETARMATSGYQHDADGTTGRIRGNVKHASEKVKDAFKK